VPTHEGERKRENVCAEKREGKELFMPLWSSSMCLPVQAVANVAYAFMATSRHLAEKGRRRREKGRNADGHSGSFLDPFSFVTVAPSQVHIKACPLRMRSIPYYTVTAGIKQINFL